MLKNYPARLRERFTPLPTSGGHSAPFQYEVHELEGIPEGGNCSHDLRVFVPDHEIRLHNQDGWGYSDVYIDGEKQPDPVVCPALKALVGFEDSSELETLVCYDYLQRLGASEEEIGAYWALEGWTCVGGSLQQELVE